MPNRRLPVAIAFCGLCAILLNRFGFEIGDIGLVAPLTITIIVFSPSSHLKRTWSQLLGSGSEPIGQRVLHNTCRLYKCIHIRPDLAAMSGERNQYWIPNFEINRKVITDEIQYYLGPDSSVRPYSHDVSQTSESFRLSANR
jgi:hypothetical protein